jgi:hypothetical protein
VGGLNPYEGGCVRLLDAWSQNCSSWISSERVESLVGEALKREREREKRSADLLQFLCCNDHNVVCVAFLELPP